MSRVVRMTMATVLAALMITAGALAAAPKPGGIYEDSGHRVIVGVVGTHEIKAFDVTCHGKIWVARAIIGVHLATGSFFYSGEDRLARNGRVTSKKGFMTASGTFTSRGVVTGHTTAGGCGKSFRAVLTN